jgi:phosphoribosylformylglycinamidine synthase
VLALLAHPNIASKEAIIRRYDHEIGGATLVRPLVGAVRTHPPTAWSSQPLATSTATAIGIGVNPWYGITDPSRMAHAAGRRGDPQRRRSRRRPGCHRADGQLLVG